MGVVLSDSSDQLVWCKNKMTGKVSAKLAYNLILETNTVSVINWWNDWLWKVLGPLKVKLFVWLYLKY